MSDVFYKALRLLGTHAFWVSSSPVLQGLEHIPREGACLIASTHTSPYDIALLIRHVPRLLDFVSTVEVFSTPFLGWFYGHMNAFPLDRRKADAPTVRKILHRLERGRVVVMFPEGGFRRGKASVVHSRTIRPGVGRIIKIAQIPVIPAVLINTAAYSKTLAWFPFFQTRYAVAFGPPISPDLTPEEIEAALVEAMVKLYEEVAKKLPEKCRVL